MARLANGVSLRTVISIISWKEGSRVSRRLRHAALAIELGSIFGEHNMKLLEPSSPRMDRGYDYVLIDSRTGYTDMETFAVLLTDVLVCIGIEVVAGWSLATEERFNDQPA